MQYWEKIEESIKETFLEPNGDGEDNGHDCVVMFLDKEKTKQLIQAIEAEIAKIETEKKGVKDSTDLGLLIGRQGGLIDAIHIILQNNLNTKK